MSQAVKTYSDGSVNGAADQTITTLNGLPSIPAGATLNSVVLSFTCDRSGGRDDNEIRVRLGSTIHYYIQDLGRNDSRTCDITGIVRNNGGTLTYSDGSTSLNLYAYHAFKLFDNANWKLTNIKITANYTLKHTVTLNPNGGSVSPTSVVYDDGATYGTLPTPTRKGYKFLYWAKEDGTRIYSSTTITSNHTLVAQWESVGTFYVYFSGYGATSGTNSAPSAITATYGQSYTLPTPNTATFYKQATIVWNGNADDAILNYTERSPNCTFIGWKRDPNTSTLYQPGESVNIEPTTEGGNVTFYATWQPATREHPSATREGYKLKEWNTKADGSGTAYTGASISTLEDITLYAQWEVDKINKIYVGTSQSKAIYVGTSPVKAIYVGTTKVYG